MNRLVRVFGGTPQSTNLETESALSTFALRLLWLQEVYEII
jgi:hypothetical protein